MGYADQQLSGRDSSESDYRRQETFIMSFYMTLASNGSTQYFPNNTGGSFVTKLPSSVDLEGDYEVGLSEVHMSNTYSNIRGREFWFQYINGSIPMIHSPRKFAVVANELFYNGNDKDVLKGDYVCTVKIPVTFTRPTKLSWKL